jgi:hypothetical protein
MSRRIGQGDRMNKPAQLLPILLMFLSWPLHAQDLNSLVPLKSGLVHILTKDKAGQEAQSSGFIVRDAFMPFAGQPKQRFSWTTATFMIGLK